MKISDFIEKNFLILLILPAAILSILVMLFPMIYSIFLSLHESILFKGLNFNFVGIKNYLNLFTDRIFITSLLNTFYFLLLSIPLHLVVGTALAVLIGREFKGDFIIRGILVLPTVATPVAAALIWGTMFNPSLGILNYLLEVIGLPPSLWVTSCKTVIPSLVLVDSWATIPLSALIIMSGIQSIPSEIVESAKLDGANRLNMFRYVMLPFLKPSMIVAAMFQSIQILRIFDPVWVITQGGPRYSSMTLNLLAYRETFEFTHMGKASCILIILFIIIVLFCGLLTKYRKVVEF